MSSHYDYHTTDNSYSVVRRPDPRIQQIITSALGDAQSVINVGAGTGNYEPANRRVVAVEPSLSMIRQRRLGSAPAILRVAEDLPFAAQQFDVALAILTLHHWCDLASGLQELRRVAKRQVVMLFEPSIYRQCWLIEYFPECLSLPSEVRAPGVQDLTTHLNVQSVIPVPVPADCIDGFAGAYWRRPHAYLDPSARAGISSLAQVTSQVVEKCVRRLRRDLESGRWHSRHGHLRALSELDIGYRLLVAQ